MPGGSEAERSTAQWVEIQVMPPAYKLDTLFFLLMFKSYSGLSARLDDR